MVFMAYTKSAGCVIGLLLLSIMAYSQAVTDTVKKTDLQEVNITAKPPLIRMEQGRMIVDVAASVTNVGATVLEVLEKSPGVTVDRNSFTRQNWGIGID